MLHRGTFRATVMILCCWSGAHAQGRGIDACLSLANESAQMGDLHAAELQALECLQIDDHAAPVLAYLGVILTKQGRLSEADKYLEGAIRVDASRTNTRFNLALNEFRLGKFESATGNLESVLRAQPRYAPASLLLGTILAQKGECRRAVALLEPVAELAERQPDSAAALSRCYYVAGNRGKARQILVAAVEQSQTPEWALVAVEVALQSSDAEAAEAALSQARLRFPNDPQVAYTEALIQFNAGRFAESQAILEGLTAGGPGQADVLDLLAWCWHRQGHEAEAARFMQQAIELEPSRPVRYTHLAQMLIEQKNYPEAFIAAQNATGVQNADAAAWKVRAIAEFGMSMFKQALNSADRAAALALRDADPLLLRGEAEQKLFLYAEAKTTFEKGIRLFSSDGRFSLQYGQLLLDPGGPWSEAERASGAALLENMLARDNSLFEAHVALAKYLVRTGAWARALPHLAAAAKQNPKDGQVHLLLASAYRQAGRRGEAAEEIRLFQTLQASQKQ